MCHRVKAVLVVVRRTNRKQLSRTLDTNLFDDFTEENESSDEDLPTFLQKFSVEQSSLLTTNIKEDKYNQRKN